MTRWRVLIVAAVAVVALAGSRAPAHAVESSGTVRVTAGERSSELRNRGGSATVFSLDLPDNSTCPGDSTDDNYRVQSFLVPTSVDPGTIRYKSQGPDVAGGWALYKTTTNAYIQEQTADAKEPGDPGPIIDLPSLSFAVFTGDELRPGRYHMGVACSLFNETKKYWSTEIVIQEDDTDRPARRSWRLVSSQRPASDTSAGTIAMGAVVMAAVVAGAVFLFRRDGANS